jgi:hypothetical protein
MAAIVRNSRRAILFAVWVSVVSGADQRTEARQCVSGIATALTAGDPAEAIDAFDKSFAGYDQLRNYFAALTNAFQLGSEVDVTDEEDSENQTTLTLRWALALTDLTTSHTENRSADLTVKVKKIGRRWKIVDLSPLEFFNPRQPAQNKR